MKIKNPLDSERERMRFLVLTAVSLQIQCSGMLTMRQLVNGADKRTDCNLYKTILRSLNFTSDMDIDNGADPDRKLPANISSTNSIKTNVPSIITTSNTNHTHTRNRRQLVRLLLVQII